MIQGLVQSYIRFASDIVATIYCSVVLAHTLTWIAFNNVHSTNIFQVSTMINVWTFNCHVHNAKCFTLNIQTDLLKKRLKLNSCSLFLIQHRGKYTNICTSASLNTFWANQILPTSRKWLCSRWPRIVTGPKLYNCTRHLQERWCYYPLLSFFCQYTYEYQKVWVGGCVLAAKV